MALANGSDGLWYSRTGSTSSAVREFTGTITASANTDPTIIRFTRTSNTGATSLLTFWGRIFCERSDGTANYSAWNGLRGVSYWVNTYWEDRYNYSWGGAFYNMQVYPWVENTGNYVNFRPNYYGGPGFQHKIVYNIFCKYSQWNYITVSYP